MRQRWKKDFRAGADAATIARFNSTMVHIHAVSSSHMTSQVLLITVFNKTVRMMPAGGGQQNSMRHTHKKLDPNNA